MTQTKRRNLTEGNLPRQIVLFAIPVIISGIVQRLFTSADLAVLGKMADLTAVASINAVSTILGLTIDSLNGLAHGAVILVAQAIGRKDEQDVHRLSATAMQTALWLGVMIAVVGVTCKNYLPALINCPENCYDNSALYLMIYFCSAPAILVYNFSAALIRTTGDTRTPTVIIILAGLLNVGLNVLLCTFFTRKVAAVAIATLVSQVFSAIVSLVVLLRMGYPFRPSFHPKTFHRRSLGRILSVGLPCAFSQALFSLGTLPVNRAINSFGSPAIAGNGACIQIEAIIASVHNGFTSAALTFVGQNYGANRRDRIRLSIFHTLWMATSSVVVCSAIALLFHNQLLGVFLSGDGLDEALRVGYLRMRYIILFYFISTWRGVIASSIQGLGHTLFTTLNSAISILLARNLWVFFVFPHFGTIDNLYLLFLLTWILNLVIDLVAFVYYTRKIHLFQKTPPPPVAEAV